MLTAVDDAKRRKRLVTIDLSIVRFPAALPSRGAKSPPAECDYVRHVGPRISHRGVAAHTDAQTDVNYDLPCWQLSNNKILFIAKGSKLALSAKLLLLATSTSKGPPVARFESPINTQIYSYP